MVRSWPPAAEITGHRVHPDCPRREDPARGVRARGVRAREV